MPTTVTLTPGTSGPAGAVTAGRTSTHFGNPISWVLSLLLYLAGVIATVFTSSPAYIIGSIAVSIIILASLQVAKAWEKAVVLRLGHFHAIAGPGVFFLIPAVDTIATWIDQRVQTSTFTAEQTLTRDTVPVDVDAVLFWVVWDTKKASLEVASYRDAIGWAAQTALRDIIGTTLLSDLLSNRKTVDDNLQQTIDARTTPWGVTVQSVEIRDIKIPDNLQDAMSRQAQAERERQARVILGEAEQQIAQSFVQAAKSYATDPIALHLRAMNMLYEGLKEKGAMIVVPSSAVETMGLGAIAGLAALGATAGLPGRPSLAPSGPASQAGGGSGDGGTAGAPQTKLPDITTIMGSGG